MQNIDWPLAMVLIAAITAVAVIIVVRTVSSHGERSEERRLNRDLQLEVAKGRALTYVERTAPPPARND